MTTRVIQCQPAAIAANESTAPLPYLTNDDLPYSLRRRLPAHAQDIYRLAFNNAWERYGRHEPERREEIAHRVAWSAVKKSYVRVGETWIPRRSAI